MHTPNSICSVILAGGRGQRLGGRDKGLIEYRGKPLAQHALDTLQAHSQQLVLSCNRNLGDYQRLAHSSNATVVTDEDDSYSGPLAGLLAASRVCQQQWLFTMPCDMPDTPAFVLPRLSETAAQQDCDIAVCHDGERRQNLVMLVRHGITDTLFDYLNSGGRRVDGWQNQFQVLEVDFSESADMFRNLNRTEDF